MHEQKDFKKGKRSYHFFRNAAIFFGFVLTPIFLFATAYFASRDEQLTAASLSLSLLALLIGVILFFVYIGKIKKTEQGSKLPLLALGLELAAPILILLIAMIDVVLAILCLLPAIILPFIGIVVGIQAFVEAKKQSNRLGVFISLVAIVLPIVVVTVSVVMFSTGVWVIRFM